MPTPNFNLPLISGASPIAIVNDMNALATAADAAMGTLATQGDIAAVRTTANNANSAAAQSAVSADEAKSIAKTANDAATNASGVANTANATAISAHSLANDVQTFITNYTTFDLVPTAEVEHPSTSAFDFHVAVNRNRTAFRIWGQFYFKNGDNIPLVSIPGQTRYGIKLTTSSPLSPVSKSYTFSLGVGTWDSFTNIGQGKIGLTSAAVGTDGNIYVATFERNTIKPAEGTAYFCIAAPAQYINADFGDTPQPVNP